MSRTSGRTNSKGNPDASSDCEGDDLVHEDDDHFSLAKGRKNHGKYTPSSPLTDVRGLLSTGLLEGFPVTYKRDEVELNGFVRDLGYQCGCSSCDYTKVIAL
ncbi:hypothetical protein B296_00056642 [Ensete ventricosum]|uniref:Uncharacterized protein n=1 Tax=Ensete ventricosum TaxID=4639 RepID=A0A426XUD6_ENSVE|nr:hypothetical protein B296_00056642 [Ensete ventricosum]